MVGAVSPWSIRDGERTGAPPAGDDVGEAASDVDRGLLWHLDGGADEAAVCHTIDTLNARPAPGDSEGMARLVYEGRGSARGRVPRNRGDPCTTT